MKDFNWFWVGAENTLNSKIREKRDSSLFPYKLESGNVRFQETQFEIYTDDSEFFHKHCFNFQVMPDKRLRCYFNTFKAAMGFPFGVNEYFTPIQLIKAIQKYSEIILSEVHSK